MHSRQLLLIALISLSLAAAGCGSSSSTPKPTVTDAPATYTQNCAACHGSGLEGRSAPALTKIGSKLTEDQIKSRILNGGGGMPRFKGKMSDDQVNQLASYLASKK